MSRVPPPFGFKPPTPARPELFSKERPFRMRSTRLGARVPHGWVSCPDYLGPDRRIGERRDTTERRFESRRFDGMVPRRRARGRRGEDTGNS